MGSTLKRARIYSKGGLKIAAILGRLAALFVLLSCSACVSGRPFRPECPTQVCGPFESSEAEAAAFLAAKKPVLVLTPFAEGTYWFLRDDFLWTTRISSIRVPKGFVTDLASVPRPLWAILPKWGGHGPPAIVHDFLYHNQKTTRRQADNWMLAGMKDMKVGKVKQYTIYFTLRMFGGIAWSSNARRKQQGLHSCIEPSVFDDIQVTSRWVDYQKKATPCTP